TFIVALISTPESRSATLHSISHPEENEKSDLLKRVKDWLLSVRTILPHPLSTFIILLLISFSVLFAWAFIEPRFMFYAYNDLGWSSAMLGWMMSTYGIALMVVEFGLGRLSDRLGRKPIIIIGLLLFSAQFIGLALFRSHILIAITFIIAGIGNGLYDPALSASIIDISPDGHRARMLGVKGMVGSAGSILGPALVTLLNSSFNARGIFLIAGGIALFTFFTGWACLNKEQHPKGKAGLDAMTAKKPIINLLKEGEL
ncbi:MAG: MFS transporter, partial [Anaerolineales bacterium]|nr:MFS transporter [Anaerolineales bacterium]